MKEKKQSALSALLEYAGSYKILTYLSLILSALSSVLSLMPFVFLWRIIREVLEVQPDFSRATGIVRNGGWPCCSPSWPRWSMSARWSVLTAARSERPPI